MTRSLVPGGHYDVDEETVCYSCRALEKVRRDDTKAHEKERTPRHGFQHGDGRIYPVREIRHEMDEKQGGE